jgi:hypothetical protein
MDVDIHGLYLVILISSRETNGKTKQLHYIVLYGFLNNRLNIVIFTIRGSDGVDDTSSIT